jgi:hypothetical protein
MKKLLNSLLEITILVAGVTGFTWFAMSQWLVEMA